MNNTDCLWLNKKAALIGAAFVVSIIYFVSVMLGSTGS